MSGRSWTTNEAEEFQTLISSLLRSVNVMGYYITMQDPNQAMCYVKVAHDVIHLMESQGYLPKEDG